MPNAQMKASFRQGAALGFGRKPDEDEAGDVNERHDRAGFRVAAIVKLHELTHLQRADSGQNTTEVETDALTRGADASRKQFWKIERQPAIEGSGGPTNKTDHD